MLNGSKRVAFGTISKSAVIKINGVLASIDSEIKENDKIEIQFSKNGENAEPQIKDYVKKLDAVGFYLNDEIINMEPLFFINGERVKYDAYIIEGDSVETVFPNTIEDYKKYFNKDLNLELYNNEVKLEDNYVIEEGDKLYTKEDKVEEELVEEVKKESIENNKEENENSITIKVNGEDIILKGKQKYIFVDIFNFYNFDLTIAKGQLVLLLNGNKAGFSDDLNDSDVVEIKWN